MANEEKTIGLPRYAMAYGVSGFGRSKQIRVKVTRIEGEYVWCRTATVADCGTPLVLSVDQIEFEWDDEGGGQRHTDGLVTIDV